MSRARITQTDGFHRTEADSILPAQSHDFYRHTALVDSLALVERVGFGALRADKGFIKRLIFLFVHRTVYIVILAAPVVARLLERAGHIEALSRNYRRGGIVEAQMSGADFLYLIGERVGRERTCGDNHNAVCGYLRHLAADYIYKRIFFDCLCDKGGEIVPVNG